MLHACVSYLCVCCVCACVCSECVCECDYKRRGANLEGADESIADDFLCVEHFDLHHAVKHFLRSLVEAEVEHLNNGREDQTAPT